MELNTLSYVLLTTIFSATSYIAVKHGKHPDVHPLVLNNQGEFSKIRYPQESATIKSKTYPLGVPALKCMERVVLTLTDFYQSAFLKHHKNPKFSASRLLLEQNNKKINWQSYDGALEKIQSIFSGLVHKTHLVPCSSEENSFVGIYASTSPDAFMTEIACHWGGLVTIPIAAQASSSHILHVLRNTSLKVLVIDETHLEYIVQLIQDTNVTHIVTMGDGKHYNALEREFGVTITCLSELMSLGKENKIHPLPEPTRPDTIASIYYSTNVVESNTENNNQDDKSLGVVLTHRNILTSIASHIAHMPASQKIKPTDRLMHSFGIDNVLGYVLEAATTFLGASIVFEDKITSLNDSVDVSSVLSTIQELKPTIYGSDALFLRQVRKLIENKYGTSFLFQRGLDRKDRYFAEGRLVSDCIYDMLVFRDIRQTLFGGTIRTVYMTHDEKDTSAFYRAILGAQVIKIKCQPETSGCMTSTIFYDYSAEKQLVGPPSACMEIKLKDIKNYTAEDVPNPRGEMIVRGDNVFLGYWGDENSTLDKLSPDGWLSTGIIGELLPNGSFLVKN